ASVTQSQAEADKVLLGISSLRNTAEIKKATLDNLVTYSDNPKQSREVIAVYNRHAVRNPKDTAPCYPITTIEQNKKIKDGLKKLKLGKRATRDEIVQALANKAIDSFQQCEKDKDKTAHKKRVLELQELKNDVFELK
ncbi:MAG: hypothetical protein ACPG5T_08545, partial [Endozoicomonas sp.]